MKKEKYKYVIVSPRQHHGGSIVMHVLCKQLEELGYDASIFYIGGQNYRSGKKIKFWIKQTGFVLKDTFRLCAVKILGEKKLLNSSFFNGYVNVTIEGCKRHFLPFVSRNTIVIYPEIVYGNFLHASNVVRWFLYHNSYIEGDYDINDMFISYRSEFNDYKLNPKDLTVQCPYYNLDLYKRVNYGERKGKCYIIRKGKNRNDLPKEFDGPIIDDWSEIDKVEAFNRYEYCICYDTDTGYSSIAALCGCISVVIPEEGKDASFYRKEEAVYGVAYGWSDEELSFAKETQNKVKEVFEERNEECKKDVKKFAELSVDYFERRK